MGYLKEKKHRWILFLLVFILGAIGFRQATAYYVGMKQAAAAKSRSTDTQALVTLCSATLWGKQLRCR